MLMARRQSLLASVCRILPSVLLLCLLSASARAQRFYNLTSDEVRIDTVMPYFCTCIPLGENYRDSVYEVKILYPEFVDATAVDVAKYLELRDVDTIPGSLPTIEQSLMVAEKRGFLSVGFVPLVCRDGRYQWLVSFMAPSEGRGVLLLLLLLLSMFFISICFNFSNYPAPTPLGRGWVLCLSFRPFFRTLGEDSCQ